MNFYLVLIYYIYIMLLLLRGGAMRKTIWLNQISENHLSAFTARHAGETDVKGKNIK